MMMTIEQFLRDPEAGDPASIMRFARDSSAVLVVFDQRLLADRPRLPDAAETLLLAGFAAGSVRSQLASGIRRDSPVEAMRAMLAVYAFLKTKNAAITSKKLDELAARNAGGTLEAAVADLLQK